MAPQKVRIPHVNKHGASPPNLLGLKYARVGMVSKENKQTLTQKTLKTSELIMGGNPGGSIRPADSNSNVAHPKVKKLKVSDLLRDPVKAKAFYESDGYKEAYATVQRRRRAIKANPVGHKLVQKANPVGYKPTP